MDIVIRTSIIFVFIWIVTRALGRREMAEMTPFELILLIVMGDLVQQGLTGNDRSLTGALLAVATLSLWVLAFSYLSFRFHKAKEVVDGVPVVVVHDGEPLLDRMKIERVTLDDLLEEARAQGIQRLGEIETAVLEPGGSFAFLTRSGPDQQQGDQKPKI